tara:strand:- start:334 stop:822 length:489 start_codon:yes stop_codon:yes gene_type:complete
MAEESLTYDRAQARGIVRAFKAMDTEATKQAKEKSGGLVEYLKAKIISKAQTRGAAPSKIARGSKVVKSSKIGEINLGYAGQKFSGGGTTQLNYRQEGGLGILGGTEFGSNRYRQFPIWSGNNPKGGSGSKGWFIYPTLSENQPYLIAQWEKGLDEIIKEWG